MGQEYLKETALNNSLKTRFTKLFEDNFETNNNWIADGDGADYEFARYSAPSLTAGYTSRLKTRTTDAASGDTAKAYIYVPPPISDELILTLDATIENTYYPAIMRFTLETHFSVYNIRASAEFTRATKLWKLYDEDGNYSTFNSELQDFKDNAYFRLSLGINLQTQKYTTFIVNDKKHSVEDVLFKKDISGSQDFCKIEIEIETASAQLDRISLDKVLLFS